jgi:hypothetical protein
MYFVLGPLLGKRRCLFKAVLTPALDEIVAAMRREEIAGSRTAVWRFFAQHQITVKKHARDGAKAG